MSIKRKMYKENVLDIYNVIYSALKKKEILQYAKTLIPLI